MIFKVQNTPREGLVVIGNYLLPHPEKGTLLTIRGLSVAMVELNKIFRDVIKDGRRKLVAQDLMPLSLRAAPTKRASLSVMKAGDAQRGWIPNMKVMSGMQDELESFIKFCNTLLTETIAQYQINSAALQRAILDDAAILINHAGMLSEKERESAKRALAQLK